MKFLGEIGFKKEIYQNSSLFRHWHMKGVTDFTIWWTAHRLDYCLPISWWLISFQCIYTLQVKSLQHLQSVEITKIFGNLNSKCP